MSREDFYHVDNAPTPNSIVAAASAVVVDATGKILLHRRKDNNTWSLLGGAMEPGESIEETIKREVKEESGLEVTVKKLIGVYSDPCHIIKYFNGEIRQQFSICFECKIERGNLKVSDESYELRFCSKEEIEKIQAHPAQMIRIKDYFAYKNAAFIR